MNKFLTTILFIVLVNSLLAQVGYVQEGIASVYADKFEGRTTASGERYSHKKATCAHLTIPFGTLVKVTNLSNNVSVVVRVNDRGPFVPDRIIDVSGSVAEKLGISAEGVVRVRIEVIDNTGQTSPSVSSTPASAMVQLQGQPETQIAKAEGQVKESEQKPKQEAKPVQEQKPVRETKPANEETVDKKKSENTDATALGQDGETELYELKIERVRPSGFSVQVGSYKELANLLRMADELKKLYSKEVRVQVQAANNEKVYKLMAGNFTQRKDAENLKEKLAKSYPGCFIVEWKK